MRFSLAAVVFAAVWPCAAFAVETVESCAKTDTDLDRLACYDRVSGRTPVSELSPTTEGSGKWVVQTEKSPLMDTTDVFLTVSSKEEVQCRFGRSERPVLMLRCAENSTSALLSTNSCHLASSDYSDYGDIQYRVDANKAQTKAFTESTSNKALGLWQGGKSIPFIKEILDGNELIMRFTPYGESSKTVTFPISGLKEAIKPLREACKW